MREPWRNGPPIRHDGAGYHAWTRAIIQQNFSFCMWASESDLRSYVDLSRGMCQNKYPPGLALLHFPFMAPLLDLKQGAPLISAAEHRMCLVLGALTLWIIAALLTWIAVLLRVPPWRSTLAIFSTLFGTGLFHYATYDASFSHVHSALIAAILISSAVREHARRRPMPFALLVFGGFFTVAIRMTSVLLLAELALAYLYWNRSAPRRAAMRGVLPVALGAIAAIALQLAYNSYAVGHFTLSSYGNESFLFDRPMQLSVFASYERGLITYFPLFAVAFVLGLAVASARGWAALLAAQTTTLVILYGYWHSWMLGGGFGHRGFVEVGPLVAVVLLVSLRDLTKAQALVAAAVSISCATVTLEVMLGYWRGTFPMGEATADDYWKHLRTLESTLAGGTQCVPVRCNALKWRCSRKPEPEFSACSVAFGKPGDCTSTGECAPIVAIQSVSDTEASYVTAPPASDERPKPMAMRAKRIGPWEKFLLIPTAGHANEVRLQSLVTNRYVKVRPYKRSQAALVASGETAADATAFTRDGDDSGFSLRASNGKYVSVGPQSDHAQNLTASADNPGAQERFALQATLP